MSDHGKAATAPGTTGPLLYDSEVTREDVEGLREWLNRQIEPMLTWYPEDSKKSEAERQVAKRKLETVEGIHRSIRRAADDLLEAIDVRDLYRLVEYQEEAETRVSPIWDIVREWRLLMQISKPLRGQHGYDHERWRLGQFESPEMETAWRDHPGLFNGPRWHEEIGM